MARFLASLISCIVLIFNYRRNRRMAQRQGFGGALGCRTASELLGDYKTLASLIGKHGHDLDRRHGPPRLRQGIGRIK